MSKLRDISYSFIFPERLKLSRKKYFTSALKVDRHHALEMPETNSIFIFICDILTNNKTLLELVRILFYSLLFYIFSNRYFVVGAYVKFNQVVKK